MSGHDAPRRWGPRGWYLAALLSLVGCRTTRQGATIATDKADYPPGHTVTFTGHGWTPGEAVTIRLRRDPPVRGDEMLTTVADASGGVHHAEFAPGPYDLGVRFEVTATGTRSGLLARATFTDAAITWTGAVSTEWNTGGNWSSSSVPGSGDDVTIPANVASGRYPVVSTAAASTKKLTLAPGAGTQPSLTVSANTLTVGDNFSINAGTVTHSGGTIALTGGALSVTGTLTESGGTFLSKGALTINSGGNVNVSGTGIIHMADAIGTTPTDNIVIDVGATLTQSGGSVDTKDLTTSTGSPDGTYSQSGGTFKIYHDFRNDGTFSATGGTIEFAGNGGGNAFNAPGTNQFFNVVVDAGVSTDFSSNLAAAILVRGDWTMNGTADLTAKATTVTFNGTGTQTIGGAASTTFRNVIVNKASGSVTLARNQTVTNGDLTVSAGTLDLSSYTMNRSASAGVLTVSNGATLKIGGTNSFPTNYATHTLGATSTVEYSGTAQTVTAESYGHLTMSGSGTKTMPGTAMTIAGNFTMSGTAAATAAQALTVNGNFTLGNGTSFGAASYSHGVKGNLSNSGTFTASTSTLTLNGTTAQVIDGANATTFNALTVNNAAGITLSGVDATVGGTLTFTSGLVTTGANTLAIGVAGSVSRTSGHVVGNLGKNVAAGVVSRTFEVGDASSYTPVALQFASVTTAGTLTVRTSAGDHANIGTATINSTKSVNRTWTMTSSGIVFTTYNASLTFVAGDIDAGAATGSFIVGKYAASTWTYPTVGTRTATTTQITGATSFGDFQIGEVAYILSGNVFEDVNYGGGAGRSKAAASGVSRSGARVELYTSAGVYSTFATTDGSGNYSFSNMVAGTHYLRVVNSSVTSSRTGYTSSALAVQTYRTDATSGSAAAVTDYVGGTDPYVADPGNGSAGATFSTTTFVYSAVLSGTAQSVTKVVVGTTDIGDLDFGLNFNTVVNINDSGQGTLRQFIDNANLLGGDAGLAQSGLVAAKDNAVFMISNGTSAAGLRAANNYFSGGIATISPSSALPTVSTVMVLDAQKQPGWSSAPIIELNGTGAGSGASGLTITAGSSIVRGFVINRFTGAGVAGIKVTTAGGNTIEGNYVGTNAAGTAAQANYQGIHTTTSSNTIGGSTASQRNVISGNTWRGILVDNAGGGAASNIIQGNYVGTNATGTAAIANSIGIYLSQSPTNTIGGINPGEGNVSSGNTNFGIYLVFAGTSGNLVQGNTIGLDKDRSGAVPNGSSGIEICCAGGGGTSNTIGGTTAAAANVISDNTGAGIRMLNGSSNAILGNAIYGNGGIGIDLGNDNVTANDAAKPAGTPNLQMDFPVFTSVLLSGTTLTVAGHVGSAPSQALFAGARVEIFKSDNDGSGNGEGQAFLGYVTSDGSGNISGSIIISGLNVGDKITGTATDGSNNTSEFGGNVTVAAPAPSMVLAEAVSPSGTQLPGTDLAYTTTFTNSGTGAAVSVVITNPIPANTDFKLGSVTQNLGTTGLSVVLAYSNDGGSTWTYTPVSGAGGAPAGYDRLVTQVRWSFSGSLSQTEPNNSGTTGATMRIQ